MDLSVSQLSCHRGDRVLFVDISFSLSSGQAVHLAGPNGCGKTTLLRSVAGLTLPEKGDIRLNGATIAELGDEYRSQLAYVGHLNGLQPELNIRENLRYLAALVGSGSSSDQIDHAVEQVGLASRAHLPTKVLSQGQKRRAALARLFLESQKIWLLDEPVTALDTESIAIISNALSQHLDQGGLIIYTSHQPLPLDNDRLLKVELGS